MTELEYQYRQQELLLLLFLYRDKEAKEASVGLITNSQMVQM